MATAFYLNRQGFVNIILNSCTADPDGFRRAPRISDRGYNTRLATDKHALFIVDGIPLIQEHRLCAAFSYARQPFRCGRILMVVPANFLRPS